jgi:site-specific DNA-methyltransferase (adenine-specific)
VKPHYVDDAVTLYHGDALAVLQSLPNESVDGVITDPPYSSGGMVRGDRTQSTSDKYLGWAPAASGQPKRELYNGFTGDNRDQRGYLAWAALWLGDCRRIAKPGAHLLMFTDWRQLPTTTDAVQAGGWVWRGVAIWDKGIGRPMKGRFRNHVEYLVWATNGPVAEQDVYLDSVFRHAPPRPETREHMTEKPVGLIRDLLPLVPKGGTVLDPFMGSGTTGAACVMDGRKFIGVELTEHYADVAADRLRLLATGERSSQEQVAMDFGGAA